MARRKRKEAEATKPELPITPMLDMSFQLLAFFIVTFKPPDNEVQLAMQLPSAGSQASSTPPSLEDPPPPALKISVSPRRGVPYEITVAEEGIDKSTSFVATDKELDKAMRDLTAYLAAEFKARKADKDKKIPKIDFQFADEVQYRYVMRMLDDARNAGFLQISPGAMGKKGPK